MKITIPLLLALLVPCALLGCSSEERGEADGPLMASDPACRSGRSACEYKEDRKSEQCSSCTNRCVETLGPDCNSSRSCSSSCSDADCDDSDLEWCSDYLEGL